jgi:hypothetical protein
MHGFGGKLVLPTADAIAMMDLFGAFAKLSSESRQT